MRSSPSHLRLAYRAPRSARRSPADDVADRQRAPSRSHNPASACRPITIPVGGSSSITVPAPHVRRAVARRCILQVCVRGLRTTPRNQEMNACGIVDRVEEEPIETRHELAGSSRQSAAGRGSRTARRAAWRAALDGFAARTAIKNSPAGVARRHRADRRRPAPHVSPTHRRTPSGCARGACPVTLQRALQRVDQRLLARQPVIALARPAA